MTCIDRIRRTGTLTLVLALAACGGGGGGGDAGASPPPVVVVPPLVAGEVGRQWSFSEYRGDRLDEVVVDHAVELGGDMSRTHAFGPTAFDAALGLLGGGTQAADGIADGAIGSSADGRTLYVGAEAPLGNTNLPADPIGSRAALLQVQTFIKRDAAASLKLKIARAFIEVDDRNAVLGRICPPQHASGLFCPLIEGRLYFDLVAMDTSFPEPKVFQHLAGGATLSGFAESWSSEAWTFRFSRQPFWTVEDFDFVIEDAGGASESHVVMSLREPHSYVIDLSSIPVGRAFHLLMDVQASAHNRIGGPPSEFASSAGAYLGLPANAGEATLEFSGLEVASNPPGLALPADLPVAPAACVPGPGPVPAAGVLQFSATRYLLAEGGTTPVVTVTRSGGSSGAVTARFTTSDGSASAGTDYQAVDTTVFFADGDATPRRIEVPIVQDTVAGEPDRTVNLALSQPGGCAALGTPGSAVLTIRDDEPRPPLPSGLDPTFGSAGKASATTGFGRRSTAMALQPDGKFVVVGGSLSDFVLARFNADGSLDAGFGAGGLVRTDIAGGFAQEEARAVAIQPDGRIVVVGFTEVAGRPVGNRFGFALVRYLADGSLDTGFGTGGKVSALSGGIIGQANAVALQPDGRIVVAGTVFFDQPTNDGGNFQLARYHADGRLDDSFGLGGQPTTDFGPATTNEARNLVIQPDGAIVVSGDVHVGLGSGVGFDHTDVARYQANGNLDTSFGSGGRVTLDGASVGEGLALQADGRLVLVGKVEAAVFPATQTRFALMRLNADGSIDSRFGTAGSVGTAFSTRGDAARSVVVQRDGKIVVAGDSNNQLNSNFAVARYHPDGTLDTGFGVDGQLTVDFFLFVDRAETVLLQPDGRIVLGGLVETSVTGVGYGLVRIDP